MKDAYILYFKMFKNRVVTLLVLNEYKFKEFKEEHSENMQLIFATLLVLNEDKFIEFKEEQLENK